MSATPGDQDARDTIRDAHGRTLFVEAGAGTGKTTALVARVVAMVASGALPDIGGLAAITFTDNAAAELRNRVREALELAGGEGAAGRPAAPERARCRDAAARLDDASITTLHGFAARILADFPIEAGLPPGFGVSDAIGARLRATAAWRGFLDDLLGDPAVEAHVLAGLALGLTLDRLRQVADALSGSWDLIRERRLAEVPLPALDLEGVLRPLRAAAAHAAAGPVGDALTAHLEHDVLPAVAELEALTEPDDRIHVLNALSLRPFSGNAGAWSRTPVSKATVAALLAQAGDARGATLEAVSHAVTTTLCARVQEHVLAQVAARRRAGLLDFHDLLVLTRDVLRTDASVRRRLHERYPALLIDEFQDTDPLQVEIACLIAGDCGEVPPADWRDIVVDGGRLFFVGDPMQSIYRFRRASVQLFTEVGAMHAAGHTRLDVNFRSLPGILEAVNVVFRDLIGADPLQVTTSDLRAARASTSAGPPVIVLGGPRDAVASVYRDEEAAHLAATIVRAKAEGWRVGREPRPASYQDMAILLPTRTSLPAIETALLARDVPYRVESRSLVWGTDAVRDVVTLLQSIDNPADDVATVAALRHHGLACSDRHLAEWAAAGGRWNYLAPVPPGIGADHPVAEGMVFLREFHDLRWWLPVNELAARIIERLRLVELTAETGRPRDHWRRLRFLVDQARAFCDAGGAGLGDFVAWAADQIESEADVLETVVPEADDDAVRILTVHGSKGLEFPITLLAGLAGAPRQGASVIFTPGSMQVRLKAAGYGPAVGLLTEGYVAAGATEKDEDLREGTRLLYVAMTRARDHLVLGCYHRPNSGQGSHAQSLWRLLADRPDLAVVERAVGDAPAGLPVAPREWVRADDRATFVAARSALLASVRSRVATSATALVGTAAELVDESAALSGADGSDAEADKPEDDVLVTVDVGGADVTARRPRLTGAAIGTAVHWALEHVTLAGASHEEMRLLAIAACADNDIPALADDVAGRVRTALVADVVSRAAGGGRFWREVYVVARSGQRFVEGYVDLLVEDEHGELMVVDYKTDRVRTADEVAAKQALYGPQLDAYRTAVTTATGRDVRTARLVFAHPWKVQ